MNDFIFALLSIVLIFSFIYLIIYLIIFCIRLPIIIAKNRNINGIELKTISILSWISILIGITWPIALILSLIYKPKNWIDKDEKISLTDLEKLDKLNDLKDKGVLSKEEFEQEKANILKND